MTYRMVVSSVKAFYDKKEGREAVSYTHLSTRKRRGHQFFRNLEDTVTGSKDIVPVENFMDMGSAGVKKH